MGRKARNSRQPTVRPRADRPAAAPVLPADPPPTDGLTPRRATAVVAVLTGVAFVNSFFGVFVLDDIHEIERNPHLAGSLWEAMTQGKILPPRPLPYLTFALDYRLWGIRPFGYHLLNVAIHMTAAVALFALVRRTLLTPRLRSQFAERATLLALVVAILWAVHPLQTQAVTYVYQRIESLTGMCMLVCLACYARAAAPAQAGGSWDRRWLVGSLAAAAGAMASKENAVVLPLLVLAWDWFFAVPASSEAEPASGSGLRAWLAGLGARRWFFAGLVASWGILAAVLLGQAGEYQEFQELQHSPWHYLLTQSGVILHYLRLTVWPVGQKIDYASWPVAGGFSEVWPAFLTVGLLVAATAYGTLRRKPWAAPGALFFLALAPTSSLMPIEAVANEHRMYVALAGVIVPLVLAADAAGRRLAARWPESLLSDRRLGPAVAGMVIVGLIGLTQVRNQLYATRQEVWYDLLEKDKGSFRAYQMMASTLDAEHDVELALLMAEKAIRLQPKCSILGQIAKSRWEAGHYAIALACLNRGLEISREELPETTREFRRYAVGLATFSSELKDFEAMRRYCEEALEVPDGPQGPELNIVVSARLMLAEYWQAQQNEALADQLSREAVNLAMHRGRPTAKVVLDAVVCRATILKQQGRQSEACTLLAQGKSHLLATAGTSLEDREGIKLLGTLLTRCRGH